MKQDPEHFFQELKNDVTTYAELRLELLKLDSYERIGKVLSVLSYGLIFLALAFFFIFFIFISLGFFLGNWLGSMGTGFSIVSVIYLLLIGATLFFKKQIQSQVLNSIISALTANDKPHPTDETSSAKTDSDQPITS